VEGCQPWCTFAVATGVASNCAYCSCRLCGTCAPGPPPPYFPPAPPNVAVLITYQITASYVAAGDVSVYDASRQESITQQFATTLEVQPSLVALNITNAASTSRRRRLSSSVVLQFTVDASSDQTSASALQTKMQSKLGSSSTASAALGVPVLQSPTLVTETINTYQALPLAPPTGPPAAPPPSSSDSATVIIIVVAVVGILLVLLLAFLLCRHMRLRKSTKTASRPPNEVRV